MRFASSIARAGVASASALSVAWRQRESKRSRSPASHSVNTGLAGSSRPSSSAPRRRASACSGWPASSSASNVRRSVAMSQHSAWSLIDKPTAMSRALNTTCRRLRRACEVECSGHNSAARRSLGTHCPASTASRASNWWRRSGTSVTRAAASSSSVRPSSSRRCGSLGAGCAVMVCSAGCGAARPAAGCRRSPPPGEDACTRASWRTPPTASVRPWHRAADSAMALRRSESTRCRCGCAAAVAA